MLTNTYDSLGRLQYRDIGLNSNYRTALTYLAGAGGSSTALLATYTNGSDDAYSYTYDANGNITEITQGNASVSYSYNAASELIRENNGFTGQTVIYSYDLWGNLLEKVTYAYSTAEVLSSPVETITYNYTNPVWHDELTGLSITTAAGTETQVFTYDNNGNALTYRGASLTWDGKQLASYSKGADTLSFSYDDNGLRLSKTHNNETTSYYYNGSVLMSLVKGNDTLLFSYDQGGNVISVNHNGTDYYYLRNGQNDIVRLIDGSGSTVVEYSYNSWGEQTGCAGTLSTALGTLNPFRYRGYVYDEETGLYYLQSRYYDPDLCRFISADVFLSTGQGVIGCNAFAYCANEPVNMADTTGELPFFLVTAAIGAVAGAIIGGVVAAKNGGNVWAGIGIGAAAGGLAGAGLGAAAGAVLAGSAMASTAAVVSGAGMIATAVSTGGAGAGLALVADNISRAVNNVGTVLYSGGEQARQAATTFANNTGGTTIDPTVIGQVADAATKVPGADFTTVWSQASAAFCHQASGVVNAFVSNSAYRGADSIFWSVEMPTLLNNPRVTEIIIHIFE